MFIDRANRICRRAWPRILRFYTRYSRQQGKTVSDEEVFARSVRGTFLNSYDFYIFDPIHRMPAPKGEKAHIEEVIGNLQRAVELGQRRIRVHSLSEFAALFEPYNLSAYRYGWDACLIDGARLLAVQLR